MKRTCPKRVSYESHAGHVVAFRCKHLLVGAEEVCACCADPNYDHSKGKCNGYDTEPDDRAYAPRGA